MPRHRIFLMLTMVLGSLVGLAYTPAARAEGCYACGVWMPTGVNLGAGWRSEGDHRGLGLLLGGEVSVIDLRRKRISDRVLFGAYVDGLYDLQAGLARATLGPEMAVPIGDDGFSVGLDAGVALQYDNGGFRWGGRARLFVPFIFFIPYVGHTRIPAAERPATWEFGILLKYPFALLTE
jgi:hypothetical protein